MLQVLACVVLGVLAGLRFALLILLVTMLVPLCIIEYSDFLSLVVVFAQPEKWVFGFYGEVEFSLLCWGESSPIRCEGLVQYFSSMVVQISLEDLRMLVTSLPLTVVPSVYWRNQNMTFSPLADRPGPLSAGPLSWNSPRVLQPCHSRSCPTA